MSLAALAALAGLALIDSTSFGTLVLPLMMLLSAQVRTRNVVVHLVTIAVFYFGVGVALVLGAESVLEAVTPLLDSTAGRVTLLAVGLALVVVSFLIDPKAVARRRARRGLPPKAPSGSRQRALGADATLPTVVGVALLAGLVEVASMLPYLGAVGLIVTADLTFGGELGVLAGYAVVMIAPALVLLVLRLTGGRRLEPRLQRIEQWMSKRTSGATSWVVGILGVLIAFDALRGLTQGG